MNEQNYQLLEQELQRLRLENGRMKHEVTRLHAYNSIQKLMADFLNCQCRHSDSALPGIADSARFFARRADSSMEVSDYGVHVGWEHIDRVFREVCAAPGTKGVMYTYNLTTPMIVVAQDGQTARGLWFVPGQVTDPLLKDDGRADGKPSANWCWGRILADFLLEDGEWRIWHYHYYLIFRNPYRICWTDYVTPAIFHGGIEHHPAFAGKEMPTPDRPCSYHAPYSADHVMYPYPDCPVPYETWSEALGPV